MADLNGLKPEYVSRFAGSSDPLHRSVVAFTSPAKSFVAGDPGYEAGARAADYVGAKVIRVPLNKDYSHDVKAMVGADPGAGVIYVCNPNNPTGTLTKRSDIDWLVANKPKGAILLLDEAYIHFSGADFASDLVAADKDVIILRTFSKLYGMAGLRAGAALGHPDLLAKLKPAGAGMLPVTGMVGGTASLQVKTLVPERRKALKRVRKNPFAFLTNHNFSSFPPVSNSFMPPPQHPRP